MNEGVVLIFNETTHSFFVSIRCLALLLSLLSGLYHVHELRVSSLCPIAHRQFLPLLCISCVSSLALSCPFVSSPDLGSHFAFLSSSAFVYIPMLCHRSFWSAICFIKWTLWTPLQKNKERVDKKKRCQNFKLPDVWDMISHVRASLSKDWMGNAAKSVTLWAPRQNSLLMPRLFVAYALSTMLPDHPNRTNYVSLPKVQSQGQRHCSMANGLSPRGPDLYDRMQTN